MKKMTTDQLRTAFVDYFSANDHVVVPSSSLVPAGDPTLLFTNAGMVPFKQVFLGHEPKAYDQAVSVQCCVRAGGKHNDLDNVGYTARHHTFFEMLGNFSFGSYFKKQAIAYAWDFLTEVLQIPKERLWVTVYHEDDEATAIWLDDIGVDPERFSKLGMADNFWSMGDTGPCGPCSEIFYDHGDSVPGGPPGSDGAEEDRFIEIWNMVFMQYNRQVNGELLPLPSTAVDTGMGLERIAAVMQGVHSNYEIDSFAQLIAAIKDLPGVSETNKTSALQVIADHLRATGFLIMDGVLPSNEGRGYVLRRIMRRAIRHGHELGLKQPFLCQLVPDLIKVMGDAYPELAKKQNYIERIILKEEQQFILTLEQGMQLLEKQLAQLTSKSIPGEVVFKLYDTYGFPPDLTADIARENQFEIDLAGFEICMDKQRQQSKSSSTFEGNYDQQLIDFPKTEFTGHGSLIETAEVIGVVHQQQEVNQVDEGQSAVVILDKTPFYAESGGQIGDKGVLRLDAALFEVQDTQKQGEVILHHGRVAKGVMSVGDKVTAEVSNDRDKVMANHTATHLLHAALRQCLGEHIAQKGSLVDADRLRFDFSHDGALTPEQLLTIENLVNQKIRDNLPCVTDVMSIDDARSRGAMALFDEKYGETVRVLTIGDFSIELCGGTHVNHGGDIGLFKIISQSGIAAGVRRIEAITAGAAMRWLTEKQLLVDQVCQSLKTEQPNLLTKLSDVLLAQDQLTKQVASLQVDLVKADAGSADDWQTVSDVKFMVKQLDSIDIKTLRSVMDVLKSKTDQAVIVLASVSQGKAHVLVSVGGQCSQKLHAGELVAYLSSQLDGKGGGRRELAQGGGANVTNLAKVLVGVSAWIEKQLLT